MGQDSKLYLGSTPIPQNPYIIGQGRLANVQGIYRGRDHVWSWDLWKVIAAERNTDTSDKTVSFKVPAWCERLVVFLIGGGGGGYLGDGGLNKGGKGGSHGEAIIWESRTFPANSLNDNRVTVSLGAGGSFSKSGTKYIDKPGGNTTFINRPDELNAEPSYVRGGTTNTGFTAFSSPEKPSQSKVSFNLSDKFPSPLVGNFTIDFVELFGVSASEAPGKGGDGGDGGFFGNFGMGKPGNGGAVVAWGFSGIHT